MLPSTHLSSRREAALVAASNGSLRLRCARVQISKGGVGGCLHLRTDRLIGETNSREGLLSWVCARASLSCLAWVLGYRACASPAARLPFLARASAPAGPRAGHPRCPANHTQSGQHDAVQQCVALLRHVSTHSSGRAKALLRGFTTPVPLSHASNAFHTRITGTESIPQPCWGKALLW